MEATKARKLLKELWVQYGCENVDITEEYEEALEELEEIEVKAWKYEDLE